MTKSTKKVSGSAKKMPDTGSASITSKPLSIKGSTNSWASSQSNTDELTNKRGVPSVEELSLERDKCLEMVGSYQAQLTKVQDKVSTDWDFG